MDDHDFWMAIRQALLMLLDALERKLGIAPRTAELRKLWKRGIIEEMFSDKGSTS